MFNRLKNDAVMAGLDPAIHVFVPNHRSQDVDARHKACTRVGRRPGPGAGHDDGEIES